MRQAVSSPIRLNRLGVTFLSRVFAGREVTVIFGFSVPGSVLTLAEPLTLPVFLRLPMSRDATPWTILSWGFVLLHGISHKPADSLSSTGASPEVCSPSALHSLGVHVRPVQARFGSLDPRAQILLAIPTCRLRHRPRLSQPLDGLFLPRPSCHVSDRSRSWGLPFRGLCFSRSFS